MANLTEDQQRAFGDRIVELLGDEDTATALSTADTGLDPAKRLIRLSPLQDKAAKAEKEQTKKKAELSTATTNSQQATAAFYHEASTAAEAVIAALGEEHPLSAQIRKIRGEMSNPAARGPEARPTTPKQTP